MPKKYCKLEADLSDSSSARRNSKQLDLAQNCSVRLKIARAPPEYHTSSHALTWADECLVTEQPRAAIKNCNMPPLEAPPCSTTRVSCASTGPPSAAHASPPELPRVAARNHQNTRENADGSKSSTDLVRLGRKLPRNTQDWASHNLAPASPFRLLRGVFSLLGSGFV